MEKVPTPPRRLLVAKDKGKADPAPAQRVADRVAEQYGADPKDWPKFIVTIDRVKP